ncbi:MAG: tetratricopeptide repeat protein [Methanomassiliicoccaceae archaeon]|nr:tetratricopeptide repeat protein [Methanomassiliicoccaceae archaeon]
MPPNRTITVEHGSLVIEMPCSIFVSGTSELNDSSEEYFSMLMKRYPWLNKNSITVIKRTAKRIMNDIIEQSLRGSKKAMILFNEGENMKAIQHLESFLVDFPEDADAWYTLGEILCRIGREDEGYRAINHGRRFFGSR